MSTSAQALAGLAKPLFPVLSAPEWYDDKFRDQWSYDERGPRLLPQCKRAIGISRQGDMPVRYGVKRCGVIQYTPAGCAFFNRKLDLRGDDPVRLDYADLIGMDGLVLQSSCRRKRLLSIWGLDKSELVNRQLAPGIELICSGSVNVKNWQCANRRSSYGGELHPILLHVLRNSRWPGPDDRLDCDATVGQQLRCLLNSYRDATLEAELSVKDGLSEWHAAHWRALAKSYSEKYISAGGLL